MMASLMPLQEFCNDLPTRSNEVKFDEADWEALKTTVSALETAKIATKRLQAEHLTPGDCLGVWLLCEIDTGRINSELSRKLVEAMKKRRDDLTRCDAFISSIFLDCRFNIILSTDVREESGKGLSPEVAR